MVSATELFVRGMNFELCKYIDLVDLVREYGVICEKRHFKKKCTRVSFVSVICENERL